VQLMPDFFVPEWSKPPKGASLDPVK
jgi:hypothetical protein